LHKEKSKNARLRDNDSWRWSEVDRIAWTLDEGLVANLKDPATGSSPRGFDIAVLSPHIAVNDSLFVHLKAPICPIPFRLMTIFAATTIFPTPVRAREVWRRARWIWRVPSPTG
jgi:hypothetical protein